MASNIENLFILARRARQNGDNSSASHYYDQILMEQPNNWEAVFYRDYCLAADCVIRDIGPAAIRLKKAFGNAFQILSNTNMLNKEDILYQLHDDTKNLLGALSDAAYNHYSSYSSVSGAYSEYRSRVYECGMTSLHMGDCFYRIGDKRVAAIAYKNALVFWRGEYSLNDLAVNRIREYDPSYSQPSNNSNSSGGCYVATAVYGSYDCPEVWTLRRYRDDTLASTWYGRAFIRTYYAISPTLVKWFGDTRWFKNMWKGKLDRMVANLQEQGVESTPYNDRPW